MTYSKNNSACLYRLFCSDGLKSKYTYKFALLLFTLIFLVSCAGTPKQNTSYANLNLQKARSTSKDSIVKRNIEYAADTCYYASRTVIDCHVVITALRKDEKLYFFSGEKNRNEYSLHSFFIDQFGNKYNADVFKYGSNKKIVSLEIPYGKTKSIVVRAPVHRSYDYTKTIKVLNLGVSSIIISDRNMGIQLTNIGVENTPNRAKADELKRAQEIFFEFAANNPDMHATQKHPMLDITFWPVSCSINEASDLNCAFLMKGNKMQALTMLSRGAYIYDQNGRKYTANKIELASNLSTKSISTILPEDTTILGSLTISPGPVGINKVSKLEFQIGPVLARRTIKLTNLVIQ